MGIGNQKRNGAEQRKTKRLRRKLFERQKGRCYFCEVRMTQAFDSTPISTDCTLEHLIPRCEGGELSEANCVAACLDCNAKRNRNKQAIAA